MSHIATIAPQIELEANEQDLEHMRSHPLRTATGFMLGAALSGALWTMAGVVAWYLT